jgi:hypothetical protein
VKAILDMNAEKEKIFDDMNIDREATAVGHNRDTARAISSTDSMSARRKSKGLDASQRYPASADLQIVVISTTNNFIQDYHLVKMLIVINKTRQIVCRIEQIF